LPAHKRPNRRREREESLEKSRRCEERGKEVDGIVGERVINDAGKRGGKEVDSFMAKAVMERILYIRLLKGVRGFRTWKKFGMRLGSSDICRPLQKAGGLYQLNFGPSFRP